MKVDKASRYTRTHEWVRLEGDEAVSGITDYAQEQLSDVVYVELPAIGEHFGKGEVYGVVESVKAASDNYMPVGGTVTAVNESLADEPQQVNTDPYGAGWMIRFRPDDPAEIEQLMDAASYEEYVSSLEGAH
ncbi:MAG: glycine cleavage system protein GcvH [Anaerolineae bacterium]|nr:glycine cleavage system protein GcvH [Anaerolineae bacterium]